MSLFIVRFIFSKKTIIVLITETAWNFQTPFYRKDSGILRKVYVNFHNPISPGDFSMTIYYFRACLDYNCPTVV